MKQIIFVSTIVKRNGDGLGEAKSHYFWGKMRGDVLYSNCDEILFRIMNGEKRYWHCITHNDQEEGENSE